ncbi:ATP-binding cassette domain-containing protein [Streptomyces triculaminicus]|uniref:ATP-binding cassette domain-containing protein n=1 Tax=Streptomyces triculaminicus TaxID=2816232 RepID=UPI0037D75C22
MRDGHGAGRPRLPPQRAGRLPRPSRRRRPGRPPPRPRAGPPQGGRPGARAHHAAHRLHPRPGRGARPDPPGADHRGGTRRTGRSRRRRRPAAGTPCGPTALTGPSGSGKCTLLRAVIGDLPDGAQFSAGTVEVLGHDVLALAPDRLRHLRRHQVAYVGQDPGSALDPRMRVRRLVVETAVDASPQAVRELLAECRLPVDDGLPDRRPGALSGGQQRRAALARALARRPGVLLLDEPTAGLDTALRDEIADLLRHLATTRDLAIVPACHDPELVDRCADDVADLADLATAVRPAPRPATLQARPEGIVSRSGGTAGTGLAAHGLTVGFTRGARTRSWTEWTSRPRWAAPPASSAPPAPARQPCSASHSGPTASLVAVT